MKLKYWILILGLWLIAFVVALQFLKLMFGLLTISLVFLAIGVVALFILLKSRKPPPG